MKTMIAIPCMDIMPSEFAQCLVNLKCVSPEANPCFKISSLIYDSRNLLALTAIENNFDRVLWLDSDMLFKPDLLKCLSEDMDKGYDLVSGIYIRRKDPFTPVLYKKVEPPTNDKNNKADITKSVIDYLDYPRNTIFPIAGCGFGCVLTSVDLLKRIFNTYGPAFSPLPWAGEDLSFCYRAGLVHAKMVCDSSISCGHIGNIAFTEEFFLRNRGDKNE